MANDGQTRESEQSGQRQALADECPNPVFRGFIQSWAHKIERLEQAAESFARGADGAPVSLRR